MTKFRKMYKQEGESEEEYSDRVKQTYDELFQSNEGKEIARQFMQRIYDAQKEIKSMEKKIIELTNIEGQGWDCLICCKNDATTEFKICRPKYEDNVIAFRVCNECLNQMQKDIAHQ